MKAGSAQILQEEEDEVQQRTQRTAVVEELLFRGVRGERQHL